VPLVVLAIAAVCALLLAVPGQTVTNAYVNDLFIFLDGAHRIVSGEVPNRDFHTALGPLVYYIPAAGFLLSGHLGGAMPLGTALFLAAIAPVMAYVFASRLRPVVALPLAAFLLVIAAVPMNLGEGVTALSFGMFYNRFGWVALSILVVMYLPLQRTGGPRNLWDALSAAFLSLVLIYMKVTYGAVALAFLVFMLLDPRQRRWATMALALTAASGLIVEIFWRSSLAHVSDLVVAGRVSGGIRSVEDLVDALLRHLADFSLFALLATLAMLWTRRIRDVLFYGFCAAAGLLIIHQNSQPWGIITLQAGAAVAVEALLRSEDSRSEGRGWVAAGAPLLLVVLVLPTIVHCTMALGLHASLAAARAGEEVGLARLDRIRVPVLWSPSDHDFSARYLASVRDGAHALSELDAAPAHVYVLDFVNPFSAALGLAPPHGDISWQHWGRNVDATNHLPPEELFRDVRVVMEPKWGINVGPLRDLYGDYLAANFDVVRETDDWKVHLARPSSQVQFAQSGRIGPVTRGGASSLK
jgi:hypothetical protein